MTRTKFSKTKSILITLLALVMALSACFFIACGDSDTTETTKKPVYSKVENDEQELTNGNFEYGVSEVEDDKYPFTSTNGWTRAVDNSAQSSKVNSGIVNVNKLDLAVANMLDVASYYAWAKDKFATVVTEFNGANTDLTVDSEDYDEKLKEKLTETIVNAYNLSLRDGAVGKNVYMLNNYVDATTSGVGTAQKLTSSSSFTIKPNAYGKFTVWVKTAFLTPMSNTTDFGANIRLTTTVAGVTQDEYSISNINVSKWTKYEIFVKGNDFADTTVKLVVGLGYGNGSSNFAKDYVEGTLFIDDCAYEDEISSSDYETALGTNSADNFTIVSSASTDKVEATVNAGVACLDLNSNYFDTYTFPTVVVENKTTYPNLAGDYTVSNSGLNGNKDSDATTFTPSEEGFEVNAVKSSYTVDIKDIFSVEPKSYIAISFTVNMELDKLQNKGLTVYVIETTGSDKVATKTLDNVIIKEETTYTIIVKNNFANGDRTFNLSFVFGPTADTLKSVDSADFVNGKLTVNNFGVQAGKLDKDSYTNNTMPKFDAYTLLSNKVDSSTIFSLALFAGYSSDATEENDSVSYPFKEAYSDIGKITNAVSGVANYKGVADYKNTFTSAETNENAGLINTKYLSNYGLAGLSDALNGVYEDDIQPLMIYNDSNVKNYGFVSSSNTLSANSYASVSVKVRVVGDAVAYIYLINTAKGDDMLEVLTHEFKADNGTDYSNKLFVKVTADQMDRTGWATVNMYIATGNDAISYRVEMWNGERTTKGKTTVGSEGFVFFDNLNIGATFTESTIIESVDKKEIENLDRNDFVYYTQKLDETEIKFNSEQTSNDTKVSYDKGVVWIDSLGEDNKGTFIYAIYKTINPTPVDPYANLTEDEETEEESTGCSEVDPSTFWLSLSSILLGVALVGAMVMLLVKKIKGYRRKHADDAKSHYKVTSRNKTVNKVKERKASTEYDFDEDEKKVEAEEEVVETVEETTEEVEEEYSYGEVLEDFSNEEQTEIEVDEPETLSENIENVEGSDDEKTE